MLYEADVPSSPQIFTSLRQVLKVAQRPARFANDPLCGYRQCLLPGTVYSNSFAVTVSTTSVHRSANPL